MENVVLDRTAPDRQSVALKAFARIADAALDDGGQRPGGQEDRRPNP